MSEAKAKKKKLSIPVKLAIALVLGVVAGLIFKEKASYVAFIGTLFIRLLKMCVYPLVLFSIIAGIANVADIVKLKKIGGQFLLYTFLSSAIAGVLGCLAITISGAGKGLVLQETVDESVQQVNMVESVVEWVPDNVFAALSNGTLVQIIVFAIFFGIMITQMRKNSNAVDLVAMVVEKAVKMAQMMNIPIVGLVENMSYVQCPDCGKKLYIFGEGKTEEAAQRYGVPLLAKMPIDPALAKLVEDGAIENFQGDWLNPAVEAILK